MSLVELDVSSLAIAWTYDSYKLTFIFLQTRLMVRSSI